jgi:hypothetical protein
MRFNSAIALVLPLLAAGAHLGHRHSHDHVNVHRRAIETNVLVVTQTVFTTVTVDTSSSTPASSGCAVVVTSSAPPPSITVKVPEKVIPETASTSTSSSAGASKNPSSAGNLYASLASEPHTAIIVNSCDYDVYVSSIGDADTCTHSPGSNCKVIPANTTYSEPIRACHDSGISLKVSKTDAMAHPMQFEYTVWEDQITVSYDISYLDCMAKMDATTIDFSNCVGHEKGIQAAANDCPAFECVANEPCAQQAYIEPEFGYLPGAPVGGCTVDKGIAFEICAENRS